MAIFKNTQITEKGHALLVKVLSKVCELDFTKMQAGDGEIDVNETDVFRLTGLINPRYDGIVVSATPKGKFSEVYCYFNNEGLTEILIFRELGIFANDPDEGEILYAYANAGEYPDPIGPYDKDIAWLHEEQIYVDVYTANAANVNAILVPSSFAVQAAYDNRKSGMQAENVQDAIDELAACNPLTTFPHTLQTYPQVLAIEFSNGYGVGGFGEGDFGGSNGRQIRTSVEYLSLNCFKLYTGPEYGEIRAVTQQGDREFIVSFADSAVALKIILLANAAA
jgi:hypothetical protein